MATNLTNGKTAASSKGSHGGNRGGKDKRDDQPKKSSQAAGKNPKRGEKA